MILMNEKESKPVYGISRIEAHTNEILENNFDNDINSEEIKTTLDRLHSPRNKQKIEQWEPRTTYDRILEAKEYCDEFLDLLGDAQSSLENKEEREGHLAELLQLIESVYQFADQPSERPIRRVMVLLEGVFKFFPAEQVTQEILSVLQNTVRFLKLYWPCKDSDIARLGLELEEAGLDIHRPLTSYPNQPKKVLIKKLDSETPEITTVD